MHPHQLKKLAVFAGSGTILALGLGAINAFFAARAEKENPPLGEFLTVRGTTLHYLQRGEGPPVVLLHGNGSMIQDWEASGLLDTLSQNYRVIAFDRPGYGYSSRPSHTVWSPASQGELLLAALTELGVESALFVGHSWGTLVALEMARQAPQRTLGLVLVSGYYIPTGRLDVWAAAIAAVPLLGPALCHTLLPFVTRLAWPIAVRTLFSPRNVSRGFSTLFPKGLALRPSQLNASGAEAFLMMTAAAALPKSFSPSDFPVVFLAGASDGVVDPSHSVKLQRRYPGSTVEIYALHGHMLHHTARGRLATVISLAMLENRRRANTTLSTI